MTNPPCVIWRANAAGTDGSESAADSSIKFELSRAPSVDSTGHIHSTEFRLKSGIGENEKALGPANEIQDTKFESLVVVITGTCEMFVPQGYPGAGTATSNIQTSKVWMIEDKVNNPNFPKGLFGMRLDDFTAFNLTPKNTGSTIWGIVIQDWTWTRIGEQQNRADFVATLRFSFGTLGTSTGAISGRYVWS